MTLWDIEGQHNEHGYDSVGQRLAVRAKMNNRNLVSCETANSLTRARIADSPYVRRCNLLSVLSSIGIVSSTLRTRNTHTTLTISCYPEPNMRIKWPSNHAIPLAS